MDIRKKYQEWKKKLAYRKALRQMKSRNVTRSKLIYWLVIYGGALGFMYGISCIIYGWPWIYALTPIFILVGLFFYQFIKKNWKLIWLYIRDMEQGKLMLYLNDRTVWSYEHKMKVVHWVYLRRRTIRNERRLYLNNKLQEAKELDLKEKAEMRCNVVTCPQQILDGVNKLFLVDSLIYAHRNIQILDDHIREILELTDDHISKFNLRDEIDKLRTNKEQKKIDRLVEIGKRKLEEKNGGNL